MRPESTSAKPQPSFSTHSTKTIQRRACHYALACVVVLALAAAAPLAQAQTFEVLYNFAGGTDGTTPYTGLIEVKGQLYGTTMTGGSTGTCPAALTPGCGTVFQLTPPSAPGGAWTETVIYRFQGGTTDGANPEEALVADRAGNLYGTTYAGGIQCYYGGCGTVFELQAPSLPGGAWTETVLYFFQGAPSGNGDGSWPNGLVFDKGGNLFGMAYDGGHCTSSETGISCGGAAYKLNKPSSSGGPWTEHILYRFYGATGAPASPLFDQAGNLYGRAGWGRYGCGTIFTLQPSSTTRGSWVESEIFNFRGSDGCLPFPGLVFDETGNLYGATLGGGSGSGPGGGTVYELTPPAQSGGAWTEAVLHSFGHAPDGNSPTFGPIVDSSGNVYGTSTASGSAGLGTIFEITAGQETTLHSFTATDGVNPSGLFRDANGNLYGTAQAGGTSNNGTVFKLAP
jgi:uncharacterized repeat protein (TIGR03803 family)